MKPPAFLAEYARAAEPRLRAFLDGKRSAARALPVDLGPALEVLSEYVLRGGKRLRGALVLLGCEAAGGAPGLAFEASLGMELVHAYLLVHDDWMDRDDVRRGGPTVHAALRARLGEHGAGSIAILLGSLCQAWGQELVLSSSAPPERLLCAVRLLTAALEEVTQGQALDVLAPAGPELDAAGILAVQQRKTGGYTFELPLRLGAALAGGEPAVDDALTRFARPLGMAFQIADDLLGTFGEPAVTGKANASDLREGKRTLLVVRALERASADDARALREGLLRGQALSDAEAEELRAVLRRTGAVDAARAEAERLCAESILALRGLPAGVSARLEELARFSVRRAL